MRVEVRHTRATLSEHVIPFTFGKAHRESVKVATPIIDVREIRVLRIKSSRMDAPRFDAPVKPFEPSGNPLPSPFMASPFGNAHSLLCDLIDQHEVGSLLPLPSPQPLQQDFGSRTMIGQEEAHSLKLRKMLRDYSPAE